MELPLFDEVAEALRGLLPPELGEVHQRPRRYGIKVWFGTAEPTREHYEAQIIGAKYVEGASVLALEVGFHAEHPRVDDNEQVLHHLVSRTKHWRAALGDHAVAGPFLGRPDDWRRLSETWPDPDMADPELAIEVATRLTDYITTLEPVRRTR